MLSILRAQVKIVYTSDVTSIHSRHLTFLLKEKKSLVHSMQQEIHHFLSCIHFYLSSSVKPGFPSSDIMSAAPTHKHQNWQETHSTRLTIPRDSTLFSILTFPRNQSQKQSAFQSSLDYMSSLLRLIFGLNELSGLSQSLNMCHDYYNCCLLKIYLC